MPLFHIHGLVAALLGSLSSGGSVRVHSRHGTSACFRLVTQHAGDLVHRGAAIHHAVVSAARTEQRPPKTCGSVRAIVVCGVGPSLLAELEATLGVAVVEAYGMTEASHQMASNPLAAGGLASPARWGESSRT